MRETPVALDQLQKGQAVSNQNCAGRNLVVHQDHKEMWKVRVQISE